MSDNATESYPRIPPMDIEQFLRSLTKPTMEAKYEAQNDHINHLLDRITTERKQMQVKSPGRAQMSSAQNPSDLDPDGLAELAKLYATVDNMLDELENTVKNRWSLALKTSLNPVFLNGGRSVLGYLQAEFDDIMELKRRGVEIVAQKYKSDTWPHEKK